MPTAAFRGDSIVSSFRTSVLQFDVVSMTSVGCLSWQMTYVVTTFSIMNRVRWAVKQLLGLLLVIRWA